MAVQLQLKQGELIALLEGEIDHHSARELREEIDSTASRTRPHTLTLDFSRVQFMDSSGVGLIMGRYRLVSEWGGQVCVANLPERLEKLVSLAGIRELCTVVRTGEEEK